MALSRCDGGHVVLVVDGAMTAPMRAVVRGLDGVTVLEIGTTLESLADLRLVLSDERLDASSDDGDVVSARPDAMTIGQAVAFARRLSCYRPVTTTPAAVHMSPSIAWPELMGTGDLGGLDASAFRRARALSGRNAMLSVPIGVSEHGRPVELDIKEAAEGGMGPHGLCVGATGSGKSEFLRTLTLGMIAAHSAGMLNLVLVDFKGGATFLGFERARTWPRSSPISPTRRTLVARMRDALSGEMTPQPGGVAGGREPRQHRRLRGAPAAGRSLRTAARAVHRRRRILRDAQPASRLRRPVRGDRSAGPIAGYAPAAGQPTSR